MASSGRSATTGLFLQAHVRQRLAELSASARAAIEVHLENLVLLTAAGREAALDEVLRGEDPLDYRVTVGGVRVGMSIHRGLGAIVVNTLH